MTTAISNVANTDITDLSVEQHGSSKCEIFMEEPLLDATKDYIVCCSEMAVPLSEETMTTWSTQTANLLYIRRRKVGAHAGHAPDSVIDPVYTPTLTLSRGYKMYTPSDFIAFVAQWTAGFSRQCYERGFAADFAVDAIQANHDLADELNIRPPNNTLLSFSITPSGVAVFRGSAKFWRNFYIDTTSYARTLFGFTHSTLALTVNAGELKTDPALLISAADPALILPSGITNTRSIESYRGEHSLFRFLDERMYVSLEAGDLSLPFNQLIRDGVETKTHELATFPFETKYKTTIKTQDGVVSSNTEIEMTTHISRTHFQSKTEPTFSWYPLTSSYQVQNMRLELFITRRRYVNNKWIYTKNPIRINEDAVWNASLKFISVH